MGTISIYYTYQIVYDMTQRYDMLYTSEAMKVLLLHVIIKKNTNSHNRIQM